jgi:Uma2 family endonuclease
LTHPSLSPAEFAAAMDRAGWRAPMELISGAVVVIAPSGGSAALAQTEIVHRLRAWQGERGGRLLSDVFVRVARTTWRRTSPGGALGTSRGSSPGRENDLGPKREQYLAAGVHELWLVDPAERRVVIVDATGERGLRADDLITSTRLPGFELHAASLFT